MKSNPRVLYIAYWGAAEPLGQSLILPGIMKLADLGMALTLVTFEKPQDLERSQDIKDIRDSLNERGVHWIPLRYHRRPKLPATLFDLAHGCARAIASRLRSRPDIIHARTFPGGLMGLALAPLLRARLIYHNEGFYPDEQVDGGVWAAGSTPHRIAKYLERILYARSDGVIALSHRAKREIEQLPEVDRKRTPVTVVPSCVDLDHFRCAPRKKRPSEDGLRFVYVGSVGLRYRLDWIGRFVAVALRNQKHAFLQVLTRSEPESVNSIMRESSLPDGAWSVDSAPHEEMPARLAGNDAGMVFLTRGISEHGCSPTKIGEYWATGLPVVTTANVSDTDEIVRRERVGVIVEEHSQDGYARALGELLSLLEDRDLPQRCRRAAQTHYALEPACDRQASLYYDLISKERRSPVFIESTQFANTLSAPFTASQADVETDNTRARVARP